MNSYYTSIKIMSFVIALSVVGDLIFEVVELMWKTVGVHCLQAHL